MRRLDCRARRWLQLDLVALGELLECLRLRACAEEVAGRRVRLEEESPPAFVVDVLIANAAREVDRLLRVPAGEILPRQPLGGMTKDLEEATALERRPLLEAGAPRRGKRRKEGAAIELDDLRMIARRRGGEEIVAVGANGGAEREDFPGRDHEELRRPAAQVPERLAQRVLGGVRLEVGPEAGDEAAARCLAPRGGGEEDEEGERLPHPEQGGVAVVAAKLCPPEGKQSRRDADASFALSRPSCW